jgi:uncharacterized membrane protein
MSPVLNPPAALPHAPTAPRRAARRTRPLVTGVLLLASVAYPAVVWLAPDHVGPRWIALLLVVLALARAWITRESFWLAAAGLALLLAAASLVGGHWSPLKLYPALVNLVLLGLFGLSLWRGPSVVERLARLREPALPAAAVAYTRRVTQVWCGFFLLNGAIATATALWASAGAWALYNGVIAYAAMGALMGVEWLVRRRVRGRIAARLAAESAPGVAATAPPTADPAGRHA